MDTNELKELCEKLCDEKSQAIVDSLKELPQFVTTEILRRANGALFVLYQQKP